MRVGWPWSLSNLWWKAKSLMLLDQFFFWSLNQNALRMNQQQEKQKLKTRMWMFPLKLWNNVLSSAFLPLLNNLCRLPSVALTWFSRHTRGPFWGFSTTSWHRALPPTSLSIHVCLEMDLWSTRYKVSYRSYATSSPLLLLFVILLCFSPQTRLCLSVLYVCL